ncbi:MAG: hypothetical protein K6C32_04985 [Bacilli bacterium]|nr:hypothetical protein [Bacilli bacterium]
MSEVSSTKRYRKRNRYRTGEDIDMLREREQSYSKKKRLPICDTHIDGA